MNPRLQRELEHAPVANVESSEEEVRRQLDHILASADFHASKRSQDLLRYIVEMTLAGRGSELKERTIGVEVFARSSSYDPSQDATVRVKTGEVRRRLNHYYANGGAADKVKIDIPPGSYIAEFTVPPPHEVMPQPVNKPAAKLPLRAIGIVAALVIATTALALLNSRARPTDATVRQFWGVASADKPLLLCLSPVPVYWTKPGIKAPTRMEDFALMPDRFVGTGDTQAAIGLVSSIRRLGMQTVLRIGSDVSFHDIRSSPTALIGYSYTQWNELNSGLPYRIDTSRTPVGITKRSVPTPWMVRRREDLRVDEDYAIVARLLHPDTGAMLVLISGIEDYGTEAAAELVTDERRLAAAIEGAPADWARKNLELVLHVKVISGVPGTARVVARESW